MKRFGHWSDPGWIELFLRTGQVMRVWGRVRTRRSTDGYIVDYEMDSDSIIDPAISDVVAINWSLGSEPPVPPAC